MAVGGKVDQAGRFEETVRLVAGLELMESTRAARIDRGVRVRACRIIAPTRKACRAERQVRQDPEGEGVRGREGEQVAECLAGEQPFDAVQRDAEDQGQRSRCPRPARRDRRRAAS